MIIERRGIARIVENKHKTFQAEILLDGTKSSVQLMFRGDYQFVLNKLSQFYPNVAVVTNSVFLCEMDHIKLFDCRSDDQCWTAPMTKEEIESLENILQKQQEQLSGEFGEVLSG